MPEQLHASEPSTASDKTPSQAQAAKRAWESVPRGANYVVSLELSKFFDRVNHDRLMSWLAKRIKDKRIMKLIRAFRNSGMMLENDEITYPGEGTHMGMAQRSGPNQSAEAKRRSFSKKIFQ